MKNVSANPELWSESIKSIIINGTNYENENAQLSSNFAISQSNLASFKETASKLKNAMQAVKENASKKNKNLVRLRTLRD